METMPTHTATRLALTDSAYDTALAAALFEAPPE
jgi:hypothetical protein